MIAALAGVAVLLIAGAYVARGVIFGSEAGHSPAADGGATPGASAPAVARNTTVPASATDASGAIAGSSAAAAGTATLTGVTTQVDVGSAPSFTYTAQDVPSGDSVVLQRTFGQTYEDVTTLSGANGPVTAPALDTTGKYSFRVAIEGGGSVLSASDPVTVAAYSDVPLQPLHTGGGGTVQAGNRLFSYTDYVSTDYYPNYYQHQAWTSSTCRSITVQFTGSTGAQGSGRTAYLEFVQTSKDPVYTSAPAGTVKSVTVALDGGPLYINGSVATSGFDIDITATGSCYTTTGQLDS